MLKRLKKRISSITGSGITLTNNEIKDIMEVIKSLENRGISLKETNKQIISQEGGFLNFLRPLVTAGLPLLKNVLTPLPKSLLMPFGITAKASARDAVIKRKFSIRYDSINNFKQRSKRCHENS